MFRLKEKYTKEVVPKIKKEFSYKNNLAVPRIEKVVINVGTGKVISDAKGFDRVLKDLAAISGQAPVITKAKKSISSFKIREGMTVGAMVTLRNGRMYEFLDRLISVSLPRVRDFRGLDKKSFDGKGNLTIGLKEHIVFPEISSEDVKSIFGLEVSIITTAKTDEEGQKLLKLLGFPIKS